MTRPRRIPWPELALLAMTVVWGMSFLTIKWALDAPCGVLTLNAVRNGIGLLFLLAWRTGDAGFALPGLVSSGVFFTLWWKGKK